MSPLQQRRQRKKPQARSAGPSSCPTKTRRRISPPSAARLARRRDHRHRRHRRRRYLLQRPAAEYFLEASVGYRYSFRRFPAKLKAADWGRALPASLRQSYLGETMQKHASPHPSTKEKLKPRPHWELAPLKEPQSSEPREPRLPEGAAGRVGRGALRLHLTSRRCDSADQSEPARVEEKQEKSPF